MRLEAGNVRNWRIRAAATVVIYSLDATLSPPVHRVSPPAFPRESKVVGTGHLFHIKKARPLCFLASQEVLQELRSFRPVSLKIPLHPERQKMNVSLARL